VSITGASASTPAGGVVHVFITPSLTNGGGGTVVLTGAIGDYGTTTGHTTKSGKPDQTGAYGTMDLKKGTILVDLSALEAKQVSASNQAQPNLSTCSQSISLTAPLTFVSGTGLYKGITGTVNTSFYVAFVLPRFTSGKNKGMCNGSNNAVPLAEYGQLIGSGTVSF